MCYQDHNHHPDCAGEVMTGRASPGQARGARREEAGGRGGEGGLHLLLNDSFSERVELLAGLREEGHGLLLPRGRDVLGGGKRKVE